MPSGKSHMPILMRSDLFGSALACLQKHIKQVCGPETSEQDPAGHARSEGAGAMPSHNDHIHVQQE